MMSFQKGEIAASFLYNGKRVELVPAEMRELPEGGFEISLPDGLTAILQVTQVADGVWTQLLRFEHRGTVNSGVLSRIRSFERVFPVNDALIYENITGDVWAA